jgi:hypothetical protein
VTLDGEGKPIEDQANVMQNTYRIVLARHDEPDIEEVGHYWEIVDF